MSSTLNRLNLIKNHLSNKKKLKSVICAYNYLMLDNFLTGNEQNLRKEIRAYLEDNITHKMVKYLENEELPLLEIKKFNKIFPNIVGLSKKGYGSPNYSPLMANIILLEIARSDASVFTFFFVHSEVVAQTIYMLGTKQQKEKYLPKLFSLEMIGCFCLTEPEVGSDASNLQTTAKKVKGGYILNGRKRWIGSAINSDFFIVWAKNTETNQINGFLLDKKDHNRQETQGIYLKKIEGKLSVRSVQNADIQFENVFIKEENILNGNNFSEGPAKILLHSRLGVAWGAVGVSIGAYDRSIQYSLKRNQFGKPIASFQLIQEKLSVMMSYIQAMIYLSKRASELYEMDKMTIGRCSMVKAWVTSKCRDCVSLAREIFGGNGMLIENLVIKALADSEAFYTFEGSYDINVLICGRELTGISAFK